MTQITLRFHGRFVHSVSEATDSITVLAPVFGPRFDPHLPLMSIAAHNLVFADPNVASLLTTVDPTLRMESDAADLRTAEMLVWDLSGRTVTYDVVDVVRLNSSTNAAGESVEVLDLLALERLGGRDATLHPDARALANAVVEISAGIGTAILAFPDIEKSKFITEADDANGPPNVPIKNADGQDEEKLVAEVVEFQVALPDTRSFLTLTLTPPGGEAGKISVKRGATICFSHMCAPLRPRRRNDLEFSQYYDLLASPPGPERLIPVEPPTPAMALGEGIDCYAQALVSRSE